MFLVSKCIFTNEKQRYLFMYNINKGKILISEPSLVDDTFFKSVILITHHSKDESLGLIINQPTTILLCEVLKNVPKSDFPIYIGGPVEQNKIQYIHTLGDSIPNSIKIIDGLYWGGDFNQVLKLILLNKLTRNQIRFFAGYSGWDRNQLNFEIRDRSWIVNDIDVSTCMSYSNNQLWTNLIKVKKSNYAIWANMPKDPNMN